MSVSLMDCTLRDGANVVGKGFSAEITDMVLDGLTACHVPIIEFGNAGGIGAYEVAGFTSAETDWTYLDIAQKYLDRAPSWVCSSMPSGTVRKMWLWPRRAAYPSCGWAPMPETPT